MIDHLFHNHTANQGITVCRGGGDPGLGDAWFEARTLYGREALDYLNFDLYVEEYRRCGL